MKSFTRRTVATLALAGLAVAGLTACGDDEPAEFDAAEQSTDGAEAQSPEPKSDAQEADGDAEPEGKAAAEPVSTGPVGPQDALETITYEIPGADPQEEATVTIGLHSLQHEGDVMRLELSFTPEFRGDGTYNLYGLHSQRIAPVLNDRQNLKQYTVLGSGGGNTGWQTDTGPGNQRARSGQTLMYWGYFAAPEDDIDTLAVAVGYVEFDDVSIER